jgi:hypothetical protein
MGLLLDEGVSHADMSNDVNTTDNNTAMDIDSRQLVYFLT